MTVICGGLLALANQGLKDKQQEQITLDTQKQILSAVMQVTETTDVTSIYANQINSYVVDASGNKIDGVVFTSASSVRGFFEIMSKDYAEDLLLDSLAKLSVVSIGPFTSDELKKFKVKNTVAEVHTVAGAFDAMKTSLDTI